MRYENWLAGIAKLSARKKIFLEEFLGGAKELYGLKPEQLETLSMLNEVEKSAIFTSRQGRELEQEEACLRQRGIHLLTYAQEGYPRRLKLISNPPYSLYYMGKLPTEERKAVAVVGARSCSEYGKRAARQIAFGLAEAEVEVISGMAYGIDGAAHRGALQGSGVSYAVLGCGVDVCYPAKNRDIYQQMQKAGGLISEYPPGIAPRPGFFPARNRIISGLCDSIVVVEAREKSGSLITADFALEQGKEIYAVPGRIDDELSGGTNRLIQQGAGIFIRMDDYMKEMAIFLQPADISRKKQKNILEKLERLVYSCVDLTPRNLEALMEQTGLALAEVVEGITALREKGYISEVYKNYFIRSALDI